MINEYGQFKPFSPATPPHLRSMDIVKLHLFSPATPPYLGSKSIGNLHIFHLPNPLTQDPCTWSIYTFSPFHLPHPLTWDQWVWAIYIFFTCHTPSLRINEHEQFIFFHLPHPLTWNQWICTFLPATPPHLGTMNMVNLHLFNCHTPSFWIN